MNDIEPARMLRAALTEEAQPVDGGLAGDREARMQAWLRERVRQLPLQARRRKRHRRIALAGGALGVAAAAGFVVMATTGTQDGVQVAEATWQAELETGAELSWRDSHGQTHQLRSDSVLRSPGLVNVGNQAAVQLTSPGGVRLKLMPGTALHTTSTTGTPGRSEVALERGEVDVRVPPLGNSRSFAVRTPDSEVIVHGTRFVVSLHDGGTCVRVSEGLVEVRGPAGPVYLGPSEQAGCAEPSHAAESEAHGERGTDPRVGRQRARRVKRSARRATREQASPVPEPATTSASSLAEQNALLSEGLSAELKGDSVAASRALGDLLRRFPESPLAPEARRALSRLPQQRR